MRWRSCCVWACAASRHKRQFNVSPKFVLRHVPNVGATAAQSGVRWAELDGEGKLVTLHIPCSYFFRFRARFRVSLEVRKCSIRMEPKLRATVRDCQYHNETRKDLGRWTQYNNRVCLVSLSPAPRRRWYLEVSLSYQRGLHVG